MICMCVCVCMCACVHACVGNVLLKVQGVTAAFWVLVVVVIAVVDAVTESHDRDTLDAFAATPGIWPTPFVSGCNIRRNKYLLDV